MTVEVIPPRPRNSPFTSIRAGAIAATRSSRIRFTSASKNTFGNVTRAATPLKEYAGPAPKWFPRKDGKEVPVEISTDDGKLVVNFAGKDLVALPRIGEVPRGKVGFGFRKLAFTIQRLKISGVLDQEWCQAEIKRLEKAGKLKLRPAPEGEAGSRPDPGPKKKSGGDTDL